MTSGNLQKKVTSDEYVPSAPPICSPAAEIKEVDGRIPASRAANMQSMAEDIGLSTKVDINISSGITHQVKVSNHSDSSVSFVHDLVTKPKAISFTGALVPFFFESTILPEFQFKSAYTCFRTTVAESGGRQVLFRVAGKVACDQEKTWKQPLVEMRRKAVYNGACGPGFPQILCIREL
ncbi:hypothetical protein FXO37_07412 [Capsicum annuum]|nr:hypothetical protein FXO37_07412 [Capsicum annuum]